MRVPTALILSAYLAGCSGGISAPGGDTDTPPLGSGAQPDATAPGQSTAPGSTVAPVGSNTPPGTSSTATVTPPPAPPPGTPVEPSDLTPRIRRLTNAEFDATVQSLLGTTAKFGAEFVPDARQFKWAKFDRNEAQIVDPVLGRQVQAAAQELAQEYIDTKLNQALPCAAAGDAACAQQFFAEFLPKAFRREVPADEVDALLTRVVNPAITRDGFAAAVRLGIEAVLQSAAFLYHTEIGAGGPDTAPITMTGAEIAASLSYLLTGGPPDAALLTARDAGALATAEGREEQARRLLETPAARPQVRRMVRQWLDIDGIGQIGKDNQKFQQYEALRPKMEAEADAFIDEVVFTRKGDFKMLLGADFTVGSQEIASLYGADPPNGTGIIDLNTVKSGPRRGILNQAAFLTVNASAIEASPVRRGVHVMTQALCLDPGDPNALSLMVVPPAPDPNLTVRQRFEAHAVPACAVCHNSIDSVGFTFQHFNAIGQWAAQEDGKNIDSTTTLKLYGDLPFATQAVADSAELATLISESDAGRRCFARNLARFTNATHGPTLEEAFVREWTALAADGKDSVQELLVAFVKTEFFVHRDPQGDVQ
jgi:Protein of unknown function (DUF1592)/Protein of unknown function (DUF1588)/Protein of unknown function (DUF1595)/Protein of unknown function (DUF1587)